MPAVERDLWGARGTGPRLSVPPGVVQFFKEADSARMLTPAYTRLSAGRLQIREKRLFVLSRQPRGVTLGRVEEMRAGATGRADELAAVSEVLRGNKDAFRLIVDRYKGLIVRLSLSFLGNREEAEEAAQEIFLRAFRSLHRFSLDRRLLPWLYSIAVNHLRSAYGRMRRREDRVTAADAEPPAGIDSDPQHQVLEDLERAALRRAVDSLPPNLREVAVLYYYEELSVETIATVLRIGEENVKSRLFRGRQKLRETLRPGTTPPGLP